MQRQIARTAMGWASWGAIVFAAACSSTTPAAGGHAGSGGTAGVSGAAGTGQQQTTGAAGVVMIGPAGGVVTESGVSLELPANALPSNTTLSIATTTAPAGYALASAVYQFGPAGTTFAQPVTVTMPLTAATPGAHLFWSNASGGFDDLGGTVVGTTLTGMVTHFSIGFAAVPAADGGVAMDAPVAGRDAAAGTSGGASGTGGGASGTGGGAAGAGGSKDGGTKQDAATTEVGGTAGTAGSTAGTGGGGSGGGAGHDAGVTTDAATGGDATASADASTLCNPIAFNSAVVTPILVNDGSSAPAGSTYTGGTLASGHYYLTGVTHYGSQYGGVTQEILTLDVTAKTLQIADRVGGATYYIGLDNVTSSDAHTFGGDVVCTTYPQGAGTQRAWYYTLATKLTMSLVGSADVSVYLVP